MVLFKIFLNEFKDLLVAYIPLFLEVPGGDLPQICHLQDQVQIVMIVIINHLVQLCDVWVIESGPQLYLIVYFVHVVDHLHFSVCVISDGSLLPQSWLVHHFHCKLSNVLHICHAVCSFSGLLLILLISFFLLLLFVSISRLSLAVLLLLLLQKALLFLDLMKLLKLCLAKTNDSLDFAKTSTANVIAD